jgi:hypothetical protein
MRQGLWKKLCCAFGASKLRYRKKVIILIIYHLKRRSFEQKEKTKAKKGNENQMPLIEKKERMVEHVFAHISVFSVRFSLSMNCLVCGRISKREFCRKFH